MRSRCCNEKTEYFYHYGGRGIRVCDEWNEFINFKNDMYESYLKHADEFGEYETTLERMDVNGNYEKNNCTWATKMEQVRNTSRVIKYPYKGERLTIGVIAEKEGIEYSALRWRVLNGFTLEEALSKPFRKDSKTFKNRQRK